MVIWPSTSIEETLFLISKIYFSLNEHELSKNYASILAYNFPKSKWYQKSFDLINGLEGVSEDEDWFEKFNPVKIFIQNEENNYKNNLIQSIE